jgi:hypothetical protein
MTKKLPLFKYWQQTTEGTVKVTKYRNGLKSNAKIGYTKNNRAQREEMHMNKTTQKLNYIR